MIRQNIREHTMQIVFHMETAGTFDYEQMTILEENKERLGFKELHSERNIAKLSIVGSGMLSNPGVAAKMFESLYNEGVNINMISTSEIRITVLVPEEDIEKAMNAVHDGFGLGA